MVPLEGRTHVVRPAHILGDFFKAHGRHARSDFGPHGLKNQGANAIGLAQKGDLILILKQYAPKLFHY